MIRRETAGAFIDAIYAIAATILALEIPSDFGEGINLATFGSLLLDYAMSFLILFALWVQHRRINDFIEPYNLPVLWITALVLLLVCLVPRATTLVFQYGDDVTLAQLEKSLMHGAGWTLAEFVDIFYLWIVLLADWGLLILAILAIREHPDSDAIDLRRSKVTITVALVFVLALSLLLPFENRYFLLLIPLFLIFEKHLGKLLFRRKPS